MWLRMLCLCLCMILWANIAVAQEDEIPLFSPTEDYYVEAFVSDSTPFIGEEIVYTFRYYAQPATSIFIENVPDFQGFWLSDSYELTSPRIESVGNRQYNVRELYEFITPLNAGTLTISPSTLEIPETVFRDGAILESNIVSLEVRPLPEPRPEGFHGAVGQFDLQASLDQDTVTLGQPVTLTIIINGAGNLQQLRAPILPDLARWRAYPNLPIHRTSNVGGLRLGEKTFEWLLIPDLTGLQTIPPIIFSFFDPFAEVYQTISSASFEVEVFPSADGLTREQRQIEVNNNLAAPLMSVGDNLQTTDDSSNGLQSLIWVIPPLITLILGTWIYGRQIYIRYQRDSRRKNALIRALRELKSFQHIDSAQASVQIIAVIQTYLNNKTEDQIDLSTLATVPIDDQHKQDLQACIAEAEAGRYVPATIQIDPKPIVIKTADALQRVDDVWGE